MPLSYHLHGENQGQGQNPVTAKAVLSCRQSKRGSKAFWDAEQLDRDRTCPWHTCIASEPLSPREAGVRPLCPRKDCRQRRGAALGRRFLSKPHLAVLITHQLYARPPVEPPPPILPEKWLRTDSQGVQQDTDLARLFGDAAIPLTLLAQRTGATTANAGSIHHTQASIGFSALLMRD
jgi:hypothetical protein